VRWSSAGHIKGKSICRVNEKYHHLLYNDDLSRFKSFNSVNDISEYRLETK